MTLRALLISLCVALAVPLAAQETAVKDLPSPEEVIAEVDAALAVMRAGDADAAYARLDAINMITYRNDYEPLSKHYPNLGLAYYWLEQQDWDDVLFFATSVATGLTADGYADHDYRLRASILQGAALHHLDRHHEAEVTLRNAVELARDRPALAPEYGLALYALARVATFLDLPDEVSLRHEFLDGYSTRWLVPLQDAVHINYFDIEDLHDRGDALADLLPRMARLVRLAETVPEVDPVTTVFYKGYYANLLALNGDYEAALPFLQEQRDYYLEADLTGPDVWTCVRRLGAVISFAIGPSEAYDHFRTELDYARANGAGIFNLALYQRELGYLSQRLEDEDLAQKHFRDAYAEARREYRVNSDLARHLAGLIDVDHPGMTGFAFAPELGAIGAVEFDLSRDGSDVLRLFFEGNYVALGALLDRFEQEGQGGTPTYLVNQALYFAMTSRYDDSLAALDEARRLARTTTNSAIPANALIFDIVEALARVWGTGHEPESAKGVLARMKARLPSMSASERSLYHALEGFMHYRLSNYAEMRNVLATWFDGYEPGSVEGVWDIYVANMVLEMSIGHMEDALNTRLIDDTLAALDSLPSLSLSRDYLRLVRVLNANDGYLREDTMIELGTLVGSIGQGVPETHPMISATQFALANAYEWREDYDQALYWLRKTTETMRASRYSRSDVIAFLLSRQSAALRILGRTDEALALATDSLALIDPETVRRDLIGVFYTNYALALTARSDNYQAAIEALDIVLENPKVRARIEPFDLVSLLRTKAEMLTETAELDEVLATFDEALAVIEQDASVVDWRLEAALIEWNRAIANYRNSRQKAAFRDMVASNDRYSEWLNSLPAVSGGEAISPDIQRMRVIWEAAIGWSYAETLPPVPPQ